jgi:hypothetical protein
MVEEKRISLNWGPLDKILPLDTIIAIGFGICQVTKGSELIYQEKQSNEGPVPTLSHFELLAQKDPDHDWQVMFHGPLSSETYKRQSINKWVLIDKGEGFA